MNPEDALSDLPPGFPRPDWDEATLSRVVERRAQLQTGCPTHGDVGVSFYKELFIAEGDGSVHLPTMAFYEDGCRANWRLDVAGEAEPTVEAG